MHLKKKQSWDALRHQELTRPGPGQQFEEGIRIKESLVEDELRESLMVHARDPSPARPRKLGETFDTGGEGEGGGGVGVGSVSVEDE